MAARRTKNTAGSDRTRTTAVRATAIAELLQQECSVLMELYRKKERLTTDVTVSDGPLVSVPPPSSQLDTRDKLWHLHSALLQCHSLLEKAMAKEEEELGGGEIGDYETQREMVKERLSLLLINTGELLKAVDSTAVLTPNSEELELDDLTILFELKLWIYKIYKELDHWTETAITTLQGLPSVIARERLRTTRVKSTRGARK